MRRLIEPVVFLSIAGAVHLAFFWVAPEDGLDSSGSYGEHVVSLQAISASAATMVETWETPPPAATEIEAPDAPIAPTVPALKHEFSADAALQISADAALQINAQTASLETALQPDAMPSRIPPPIASPTPQIATRKAQPSAPEETHPSLPVAAHRATPRLPPQMTNRTLAAKAKAPKVDQVPAKPPKPNPQARKTDRQAAKESLGRAAQKATGSGGGQTAGKAGTSRQESSLSTGEKQSLIRGWQTKIARRIAQKKRPPKGSYAAGTVVVRLQVSRNGQVLTKAIAKSSGQVSLDRAALTTVVRAGRLPKAPSKLAGQSFKFDVPIQFR